MHLAKERSKAAWELQATLNTQLLLALRRMVSARWTKATQPEKQARQARRRGRAPLRSPFSSHSRGRLQKGLPSSPYDTGRHSGGSATPLSETADQGAESTVTPPMPLLRRTPPSPASIPSGLAAEASGLAAEASGAAAGAALRGGRRVVARGATGSAAVTDAESPSEPLASSARAAASLAAAMSVTADKAAAMPPSGEAAFGAVASAGEAVSPGDAA